MHYFAYVLYRYLVLCCNTKKMHAIDHSLRYAISR